jgi:hypothetical protein
VIKLKGKSNYKTLKKQGNGDFKPIPDNYLTLMPIDFGFKSKLERLYCFNNNHFLQLVHTIKMSFRAFRIANLRTRAAREVGLFNDTEVGRIRREVRIHPKLRNGVAPNRNNRAF